MNKKVHIVTWIVPIILGTVAYYKWISPSSFSNYIDFMNAIQGLFIFITGILLALLGSINIFRNYSFIKNLFQLNVDLEMTKKLLKLIFMSSLFVVVITLGLLFDKDDSRVLSVIYISFLLFFGGKVAIDLMYIGYIINKIFKRYILEEKLRRIEKRRNE